MDYLLFQQTIYLPALMGTQRRGGHSQTQALPHPVSPWAPGGEVVTARHRRFPIQYHQAFSEEAQNSQSEQAEK